MSGGIQNCEFLQCLTIFFSTFLHEDAGIIAAGLFVVEHGLGFPTALLSLYAGIFTGDMLIFGLGRGARRIPWIRRFILHAPVERAKDWLNRNLIASVAVCRVVPGLLFPTFAACGLFGLSFRRFFATTVITAAVYTPVMLFLAIACKKTVFARLGYGGWAIMLAAVVAFGSIASRRKRWNFLRRLPPSAHPAFASEEESSRRLDGAAADSSSWQVAASELIPPPLFYIPVGLHWLYLGCRHGSLTLPSAANPRIDAGGLWGESKSRCMDQVGGEFRSWLSPYAVFQRSDRPAELERDVEKAVREMAARGLDFPLVAKPDIGWQGFGVRLLPDAAALRGYLESFPAGAAMMLQAQSPHQGEAGVFYIREPGEQEGRVVSLTLRFHPFVVGDGRTTLRELIRQNPRAGFKAGAHLGLGRWHTGPGTRNPDTVPAAGERVPLAFIGSIRVGGLYLDARGEITPALSRRFDAIARSMPEFHFGRFDIRFKSLERLKEGEDFQIFEINGAGAEMIHIWDPRMPLREVYRTLFETQAMLFDIAARNRARGFKPITMREFMAVTRKQRHLVGLYPPSE
jgi:membrane protein DedA with SNARE-associated domain